MAIVNIGDLLDRAADFEQRLERYYADIRDTSRDNGVRLLTYYLSRHRRHLPEVLKEYSPQVLELIRKIELKQDIPFPEKNDLHAMKTPHDEIHGHELLEAGIRYDSALVSLYRKILDQPLIAQAQELFDSLIHVEERDIVMLKKMVAMDYF